MLMHCCTEKSVSVVAEAPSAAAAKSQGTVGAASRQLAATHRHAADAKSACSAMREGGLGGGAPSTRSTFE